MVFEIKNGLVVRVMTTEQFMNHVWKGSNDPHGVGFWKAIALNHAVRTGESIFIHANEVVEIDLTGARHEVTEEVVNSIERELSTEVIEFAQAMQNEINDNAHKGNWLAVDVQVIPDELQHHIRKLSSAIQEGDKQRIREYCADNANYFMMLAFALGTFNNEQIH